MKERSTAKISKVPRNKREREERGWMGLSAGVVSRTQVLPFRTSQLVLQVVSHQSDFDLSHAIVDEGTPSASSPAVSMIVPVP